MAIALKDILQDIKQACPAGMSEAAMIRLLQKLIDEINLKADA